MNYMTMIFDLKDSRKLANRNEVQILLINALKKCNEDFKNLIICPFIITLGDEWQGLLESDCNYLEIINFFHKTLPHYLNFYVGIGIGEVTVYNFELTVNQLDGPSYYLAREAINYCKNHKHALVMLSN